MENALTIFYTWALSLRQGAAWQAWLTLGAAALIAAAACLSGYRLRRFFAALTGALGFALCGFALFPLIEHFFSGPALPFLHYGIAAVLGAAGLAAGLRWPKPFIGVCGGAIAFFLALIFCTFLPATSALIVASGVAAAGALASIFWTKPVFSVLTTTGGALAFPFLLDALFEKSLQKAPYLLLVLVLVLAAAGLLLQFLTDKEKKRHVPQKEPSLPEKMNKEEKLAAAAALFTPTENRLPAQQKEPVPPETPLSAEEPIAAVPWEASFAAPFSPAAIFFENEKGTQTRETPSQDVETPEIVDAETASTHDTWTCLCGAENTAADLFCPLCSTPCPPMWECPRCGEKNQPGSFFCRQCGSAYNLI